MADIQQVDPVKLFTGIIYNDDAFLPALRDSLLSLLGAIDFSSGSMPFDYTDYYGVEMGEPLFRIFYSFERLIVPDELSAIKKKTNELEGHFLKDSKRGLNIDPGYLDYFKVVLASAKFGGQKIYLKEGIYADLTLLYEKGTFRPLPWGFPDFRGGFYNKTLVTIRNLYKEQRRAWADGGQ